MKSFVKQVVSIATFVFLSFPALVGADEWEVVQYHSLKNNTRFLGSCLVPSVGKLLTFDISKTPNGKIAFCVYTLFDVDGKKIQFTFRDNDNGNIVTWKNVENNTAEYLLNVSQNRIQENVNKWVNSFFAGAKKPTDDDIRQLLPSVYSEEKSQNIQILKEPADVWFAKAIHSEIKLKLDKRIVDTKNSGTIVQPANPELPLCNKRFIASFSETIKREPELQQDWGWLALINSVFFLGGLVAWQLIKYAIIPEKSWWKYWWNSGMPPPNNKEATPAALTDVLTPNNSLLQQGVESNIAFVDLNNGMEEIKQFLKEFSNSVSLEKIKEKVDDSLEKSESRLQAALEAKILYLSKQNNVGQDNAFRNRLVTELPELVGRADSQIFKIIREWKDNSGMHFRDNSSEMLMKELMVIFAEEIPDGVTPLTIATKIKNILDSKNSNINKFDELIHSLNTLIGRIQIIFPNEKFGSHEVFYSWLEFNLNKFHSLQAALDSNRENLSQTLRLQIPDYETLFKVTEGLGKDNVVMRAALVKLLDGEDAPKSISELTARVSQRFITITSELARFDVLRKKAIDTENRCNCVIRVVGLPADLPRLDSFMEPHSRLLVTLSVVSRAWQETLSKIEYSELEKLAEVYRLRQVGEGIAAYVRELSKPARFTNLWEQSLKGIWHANGEWLNSLYRLDALLRACFSNVSSVKHLHALATMAVFALDQAAESSGVQIHCPLLMGEPPTGSMLLTYWDDKITEVLALTKKVNEVSVNGNRNFVVDFTRVGCRYDSGQIEPAWVVIYSPNQWPLICSD